MSRQTGVIQVVAGIICNAQRQVLMALRPQHVPQGGLWEFPGGKIEAAETAYMALCRELREEIGITVLKATPFMRLSHAYPERTVELDVWWVDEFEDEPQGLEGQDIRWVAPNALADLEFPAANQAIIAAIQEFLG
jgi:8-oxo-dGTP diphosphatase